MKKFKTKTYDYKSSTGHVKLTFQWHRGGDVEITLIILSGRQKHMSGFFAIASTKKKAMETLYKFCCHYYKGSAREVVNLLPWDNTIKRLEEEEKKRIAHLQQVRALIKGDGTALGRPASTKPLLKRSHGNQS